MNEKYKFGGFELASLTVNLIIYKSFTDIPRRFLEGGGSAAFLSALISGAAAYLIIWFLPVIYNETKTESIFELLEKRFSKAVSALAGLVISAYIILSAANALEGIAVFSIISAYPSAPFVYIGLFFAVAAVLATLRGMNGIIRVHSLIVPFCVVITLVLLPSVFKSADINNLFPVMGKGTFVVFKTAFSNISYYLDFILIFLINPFYKNGKGHTKIIRLSGAAGILVNLFIILCANLILPQPVSSAIKFPLYQLMKTVYFGRFFQRIDAIYLFSVSLSAMEFISFSVFLVSNIFKKVFSLNAGRPLAPTVSASVLLLSLIIYKNTFPSIKALTGIFEAAAVLLIALIPFFSLKNRKGGVKDDK